MNLSVVVFFNDTATTEIYTLSLHDALPILRGHERLLRGGPARGPALRRDPRRRRRRRELRGAGRDLAGARRGADRKSTRLNSSHANISYDVFCLEKNRGEAAPDPIVHRLCL